MTTGLMLACCVALFLEIINFEWLHSHITTKAMPEAAWWLTLGTTGLMLLLVLRAYRQQKIVENQLRYHASFEALVSAMSTRFINLDLSAVDDEINRAIGVIGQFMGVDRSYLFLFSEDHKTASCTHEWCGKDIAPQREFLRHVACDHFPYALGQTLQGEVVYVPQVKALGPEAAQEKREWLREEIQSLVTVPILRTGQVIGLVGFDSIHRPRQWTDDTISLLRIIGEMFSGAIGRAQSERDLQVRERAMASAANGIIILDAQQAGNPVIYVNKAFERISGYDAHEVVGQHSEILLNILANESSRQTLCQVMQEHRQAHVTLEGTRKDGTPFWSELSVSPVLNEAGQVTHCIGIQNDITEKKLAQQTQTKLEYKLRQTQKLEAVGTLASGMAHDFNNLITAILGHVDVAQKQIDKDHAAKPSLQMIQRVAQQACGVTDSLLMFAKKPPAKKQAVNLCEFVPDIMRLLARLFPASIEVEVSVLPQSPLWVWGNPTEIQQVVMNLTLNARDAMPQGGTLHVIIQETKNNPPQAQIQVTDTGAGMSQQTQSKMFDPFFTTKLRSEGTGLGLAVVRGIVINLQGEIHVQSELGQGTTMTLTMPVASPSQLPLHPQTPTASESNLAKLASSKSDNEGSQSKQPLILVAEDNQFVAEIVATTLEDANWRTILCVTGSEVSQKIKEHGNAIHLAVLDLDLPGVPGMQCLELLRQTHRDIPAVLISGNPKRFDIMPPIPNTQFLAKPFPMSQLQQIVAQMLESSKPIER